MKKRTALVVLVATFFALATPLAYADDDDDDGGSVASLTGENLSSQEVTDAGQTGTSVVNGMCNPLGQSNFTFTVTGIAEGPYPGTFSESGSFTLNAFAMFPDFDSTIESFQSTFTINSPAGTVTGNKSMEGFEATSFGICGLLALGMPEAISIFGTTSYNATINGSAQDSGTTFVDYTDLDLPDLGLVNGHNFSETFTSTAPPGGDDDDDDDDDDGGDDDDDD
jgi:hypothetical protein